VGAPPRRRSYAAAVRFRVLGAVELVDDDGRRCAIGSPNQRAVLAALLARRGEVVDFDALVEQLWPDGAPPSASTSLRTYVSRLRRTLGDDLVSRGGGYVLDVPADAVDAGRFEALLVRSGEEPAVVAATTLQEGLATWGGRAFGAESDLELVRGEARRLDELRGVARQALADAHLRAGDTGRAAAVAEALLADEPLREGAWVTLVRALVRAGRSGEGLRAAQRAREALAVAGLEPSPEVLAAERDALAPVLEPTGPPALASSPAESTEGDAVPRRPPVPRRTSSFVGRERDLVAVDELLAHRRIVTLVGPGGVGKTRLAMEVARWRAATMRDGAVWVELAGLPPGASVLGAIVAALAVVGSHDPADVLRSAGRLDAVLVLDNAEHVLDGVCAAVELLVSEGDELRVLVTSRERVGAPGEHVRPVAPLATQGHRSPARQLLVDRAAQGGVDAVAADDERLDGLLERLDGLPLAIEMAGAQLATSSLAEVAAAVEGGDGLDPLPRGVPERHRTLDAVLRWSEQRLEPGERTLLAEMGVLAGPLPAADVVGALGRPDAAAGLRRLAASSLVAVDTTASPARYGLLQTVREHARARLAADGRVEEVSARHAQWLVGQVAIASKEVCGAEELDGRRRLGALVPELRAAATWCAEHDLELAAELLGPLYAHARHGLVDEPFRWAAAALARHGARRGPGGRPARLVAMSAAASLVRGDLRGALASAAEAAASDDLVAQLAAHDVSADAHLFLGELDAAEAAYRRLADAGLRADDALHTGLGRLGVVLTLAYAGRRDEALALARTLIATGSPNPSARAWAEYGAGEVILDRDPAAALVHFDRATAIGRSVRSWYVVSMATVSAMSLQARLGDAAVAVERFAEVIGRLDRIGDRPHLLTVLRNLLVLLHRLGADEDVAWLAGFVDDPMHPSYGDEAALVEQVRRAARSSLGGQRWDELTAAGSTMAPHDAGRWALGALARASR
jgi:predicted ATPase/DNA-binding SARP family transcriptional activator